MDTNLGPNLENKEQYYPDPTPYSLVGFFGWERIEASSVKNINHTIDDMDLTTAAPTKALPTTPKGEPECKEQPKEECLATAGLLEALKEDTTTIDAPATMCYDKLVR